MIEKLVQQRRFLEGHGLDHGVVFAALALHHVHGQSPGSANKAQHGCLIAHALTQATQNFTHKGHRFSWVQWTQGLYLSHGADRVTDLGALALDDVEINPHARQGREDV